MVFSYNTAKFVRHILQYLPQSLDNLKELTVSCLMLETYEAYQSRLFCISDDLEQQIIWISVAGSNLELFNDFCCLIAAMSELQKGCQCTHSLSSNV